MQFVVDKQYIYTCFDIPQHNIIHSNNAAFNSVNFHFAHSPLFQKCLYTRQEDNNNNVPDKTTLTLSIN